VDDFELPQPDDDPPISPTPEASPDDAGEDEEAAEVEQAIVRVDKGKRRADPMEEDHPSNPDVNGLEDDIAQGLEEVENMQDDEENVPPTKKPRKEPSKPRKPHTEKRVTKTPVERSLTPEGVRRGRRHRYKPLEWWRQEKVVYGRRESGLTLVPQIKEIVRIPHEPVKPLGKAGKRKRGVVFRGKSQGRETSFNPEEGWDENTPTNATVIDYDTQEEVSRRVAFLAQMIDPKAAANSNWFFQKIFGEGEFIAAGQMHIPPKSQKPSKSTKDNTYVFYVIQGAVSVFIHETSFIITTGGMFLVPRGNTYYIENIAERDAKLFFTQARMLPVEDGMQVQHTAQSAPPLSHRRAISEDVSAGPRKSTRKA
jgi:centromere protein C